MQTPYVHPTEKKCCFFLQKNIFHVQIYYVSVFVTIFVRKSLPLKMKPVSSGAAQLFKAELASESYIKSTSRS